MIPVWHNIIMKELHILRFFPIIKFCHKLKKKEFKKKLLYIYIYYYYSLEVL